MFKGEIQTEFNISEMFQNALTGAIVGGGFGAVNTKIKELAENYRNNKNAAYIREKFSDVNDRQINDIANLTDIDVTGYKNGINKNGFNHIEKRHGINGEADQTMADTNDVARIPWVLENYDKAEAVLDNGQQVYSSSSMDKNNYPAPLIKFSKAIDGTVYVVEAVPDSQYKTLWVETAYINKNRKSLVRATDAFAPSSTPEASHTAELSDEILLRENENVNISANLIFTEKKEPQTLTIPKIRYMLKTASLLP